jgi:putative CocE/NonD family hydrolase
MLATDVYRPAQAQDAATTSFPTIVERTPYDRKRFDFHLSGEYFAARGYNYVVQDCRGRFDSEGEFAFFTGDYNYEGFDGYDTLEWLAEQPWCDDKFGTTGASYMGLNQQALAVTQPPNLAAQVIIEAQYNFWRRTIRERGAFGRGFFFAWVLYMAATSREALADAGLRTELQEAIRKVDAWTARPVKRGASPLALVPRYEDWYLALATRSDYDEFWRNPACSIESHISEYPDTPILLVASWYGIDAWGNFEKLVELRKRNPDRIKIVCGPWVHDVGFASVSWSGDVELGRSAALGLHDEQLRWFDYWLKGHESGVESDPPIRIFVMGGGDGRRTADFGRLYHGGSWRDEQTWPVPGTQLTSYYLHDDLVLRPAPPDADSKSTTYVFDPNDPVPTVGSAMPPTPGQWAGGGPQLLDGGAFDQRGREELVFSRDTLPLASRPDLIVFRSEPLNEAVEVTGLVEVTLWVSTSSLDTDFTARLLDEYPPSEDYPAGYAMNLVDCIVRLRYRAGKDRAEPVEPEHVYEIAMEPKALSNVFGAGHRIRLDISSSNFPQFDVNPNTGGPLGIPSGAVTAINTLYHDRDRPSRIELPIVYRSGSTHG